LGSQASSTTTVSIFLPFTPPAALNISTAVDTPSLTMSPYWVTGPVAGPTMAILICAWALENANRPAMPSAAATLFMRKEVLMESLSNVTNESSGACRIPARFPVWLREASLLLSLLYTDQANRNGSR
jgi:hypothetical protein